ncbi:DUF4156 domain-containing protein [Vibrio sp. CAU 1672]|uniref:DUF4156 domain-containing protein n=1 Tax=Vibrio sp. CAU 1672 TaxID=3032594 RepID=UPI0023DC21C7|nr:DUF4156 domain-containing protein [Vibrio sp. CAU 1672]MDF2155489.1 DUF4156 domain-containing protein [Vibrio sp. CAU 1672]
MLRFCICLTCAALLLGCTTPHHVADAHSQQVELRLDGQFDASQCDYLGDVIGSEGHWYSYLFYTNDAMIQGAINQLKNNAAMLGADTVYMVAPQDFVTSFSVLGTAYRCN